MRMKEVAERPGRETTPGAHVTNAAEFTKAGGRPPGLWAPDLT